MFVFGLVRFFMLCSMLWCVDGMICINLVVLCWLCVFFWKCDLIEIIV